MDFIDGINTFVRVAQSGSFSVVARTLGVSQPSVSRKIAALEAHLGVRLLSRTTRHLRLTEDGIVYLHDARKILDSIAEADARLGKATDTPSGLVRLGSPYAFARRYLVRRCGALLSRYPQLRIEIVSSDIEDNLVELGLDLAIRFGEPRGDIVARRVGRSSRIAVASPEYLAVAGEPQVPVDLITHNCIVYSNPIIGPRWTFHSGSACETITVSGSFASNSAEVVREACVNGLGITLMPEWLFHEDMASNRIRQVLADFEPQDLPIFVTYASRRFVPPKMRVVVDFLATELGQEAALAD